MTRSRTRDSAIRKPVPTWTRRRRSRASFLRNIAPYKGVEFLVDAFASLASEEPRYRLVIAGRPKGAEADWGEV